MAKEEHCDHISVAERKQTETAGSRGETADSQSPTPENTSSIKATLSKGDVTSQTGDQVFKYVSL